MTGGPKGDPVAEVRAELRQMEAAAAQSAARMQQAASRLRAVVDDAPGSGEHVVIRVDVAQALVRLLRAIASGSASRQIRDRAAELARAVNR